MRLLSMRSAQIIFLFMLLSVFQARGQNSVSIGTTSTNSKAVLWLNSTNGNQGFIIPIVSNLASIGASVSSTSVDKGMIVYNSTDNLVYFFNGSTWTALSGSTGGSGSQTISIQGNVVQLTGGTTPSSFPLAKLAVGSVQKGQLLVFDGTNWTVAPQPTITGQILKWDNTNGVWVLGTDVSGSSATANLTTTTIGLSILGGTNSVIGSGTTINIQNASTSQTGLLQNTDFNTFNNKVSIGGDLGGTAASPTISKIQGVSYTWPTSNATPGVLTNNGSGGLTWAAAVGTGTVTNVSAAVGTPLSITSPTTTPQINITPANNTTDGYLKSSDFNTFSSKVSLGGDLGGTATSPTVTKIQGQSISATVPASGEVLQFVSGAWRPQPLTGGGTVTNVTATAPLFSSGGATPDISLSGTLPVANGGTGKTSWNGVVIGSGTTLSDISFGSSGQLFLGTGTTPSWQTMSGDATINSTGVLLIDNDATTGNNLITSINSASAGIINASRINTNFGAQALSIGTSSQFSVNTTGNITKINNLTTSFPSVQAAGVLTNDGLGTLTWASAGGSSLISSSGSNTLTAGNSISTAGIDNAIFGNSAGASNTGDYNVFIGTNAAQSKTGGNLNTIIGWFAGKAANANGNTLVGAQAGENTTTGGVNTFIGEKAGRLNDTGNQNVFIGNSAGDTNTGGDGHTIIGNNADVGSAGLSNATAIGFKALVTRSNSLVLGSIANVNGAAPIADTNVGIGTTSPEATLDIVGAASGMRINSWLSAGSSVCGIGYVGTNLYRNNSDNVWKFTNTNGTIGGTAINFADCSGTPNQISFVRALGPSTANANATVVESMRIDQNGYVGIGTTAPAFPLDINGTSGDAGNSNTKYFNSGNLGSLSNGTIATNVSVRASGAFLSSGFSFNGGFYVTSDERIKRKVAVSDSRNDLATLMKLQVTDYKYVDSLNAGNVKVKGVFAQQVETIYPQAISKQTNFIPNIYAMSNHAEFNAEKQTLIVTMAKPHNLVVGDKVKLISSTSGEKPSIVTAVNGNSFTVANWTEKSEKIFVYGKEVNDFRIVDYDRLFTLNLSATQELNKKMEAQQRVIDSLQAQDAESKKKIAALEAGLSKVTERETELNNLKKQMEEVLRIVGAEAKKK
jgi:Chaperone of endosialidase